MLSASSPVVYPPSSSPAPAKRARPEHGQKPKIRGKAGFLIDDDSDEEDASPQPAAKRRMLEVPSQPSKRISNVSLGTPNQTEIEPKLTGSEAPITSEPVFESGNSLPKLSFSSLLSEAGGTLSVAAQRVPKQQSAYTITTCDGSSRNIQRRRNNSTTSYERIVAARSKTKEGRAKRAYYGIEVHELVAAARKQIAEQQPHAPVTPDQPVPSVEEASVKKPKKSMLWTEKYRARTFLDLCGHDGTNRQVLRWLKRWDSIVFPHAAKSRPAVRRRPGMSMQVEEEKPLRKILMLTGPPGLGKTTIAHVCARQAGYEVMEINASDDRSPQVVNTRIRTSLGTESVKTVQQKKPQAGQQQKVARPVCVVVDEVDGVSAGAGASGDGGFIKTLLELVALGEQNSSASSGAQHHTGKRKKKDDFKQMRPLILICNDVYHPSLRPLRQSNLAEVIHVGKPSIEAVVMRLKTVFEKEGIPCEKDAARKLCEAAWGMTSGIDAKKGAESTAEGDLRGVMVVGEWVAGRLKASPPRGPFCLTRQWVDEHVARNLAHGGGGARGVGRGNVRDIVSRVFQEGAGFPRNGVIAAQPVAPLSEQPKEQLGFAERQKKYAIERLREMVETSGDVDRVLTDIFSDYPNHEFNDDSFLTKPDQAYEWMNFHDTCTGRLYGSQDWELAPYLSQPVLACHSLFATPIRYSQMMYQQRRGAGEEDEAPPLPFSGPRADYEAREMEKGNRAMLQAIQAQLSPTLVRAFRSVEDISTEFLPYLIRLVSPDVKPVVVGGSGDQHASVRKESEKVMVKRAAETLLDVGVTLQRGKIEDNSIHSRGPTWVYRMDPDLDALATFETSAAVVHGTQAPTRYAVRKILDQEMVRVQASRDTSARQSRFRNGKPLSVEDFIHDNKENILEEKDAQLPAVKVKKDFFGRVIKTEVRPLAEMEGNQKARMSKHEFLHGETTVWVTFHEGLNNAVRKPISLDELLRGL